MYWVQSNRHRKLFQLISSQLHREFKILVGPSASQGHTILFISLFVLILFNNLLGLAPYVFTASRHLAITLSLAFPL